MKRNYKRVFTDFAPETSFEVEPLPPPPFRAVQESKFEGFKERLLGERVEAESDPELIKYLRRAANEAAALAWITSYPLLVFPALFDEKAASAVFQARRQRHVLKQSREMLVV
jgi:hypothetical protein